MNSSIKTDKDIVIEGTAGTGEKVEFANGVVFMHSEILDGSITMKNGDAIRAKWTSPTIFEAHNLIHHWNGGIAEISATEAQGIVLDNSNLNLTGSINLQGTGGSGSSVTSKEKQNSTMDFSSRKQNKTGADFNIAGTAGTGGDFVIGSLHEKHLRYQWQ